MIRPHGATWRSGYATVCKTVYTSSILVVASTLIIDFIAVLSTLVAAGKGASSVRAIREFLISDGICNRDRCG